MGRNFVLGSDQFGVLDQDFLAWFPYATGLFTLDDSDLGILDVQYLGGIGAGVVVASSSNTGAVAGVEGYAGSVSGSSVSFGSVSGAAQRFGAVTGSQSSTGAVAGDEGAQGVITGLTTNTGSAAGSPDFPASVSGAQVSSGSVSGAGDFLGLVSGVSVSSGFVSGTVPTPPSGNGSYKARRDYSKKQPKKPQPKLNLSGAARGANTSRSVITGLCGFSGSSAAVNNSLGHARGLVWLPDEQMLVYAREAKRKHRENELLLLELM